MSTISEDIWSHQPVNGWLWCLFRPTQLSLNAAFWWSTLIHTLKTTCPIQSFSASLPPEGFLQWIHTLKYIADVQNWSPKAECMIFKWNDLSSYRFGDKHIIFFLCSFPASKGVRLRFRRFGEVTKMLPCCSSCSNWSSLTWNVGKIRTIRRSIWWSCKKMGCWGPFQRCGSIKSYKDPYISCFSRSDYPWCGWRTMKWQSWWSPWYDDSSSSSSSSPSNRNASFSSALSEWRLAPSDTAARGGSKCMTSQEAAKQPIIFGQWQLCHTVKGWKGWKWWAKTQVGHATRSQFG